jgi:hypothetical protein
LKKQTRKQMKHTKGKWELVEQITDYSKISLVARGYNPDGTVWSQTPICDITTDVGEVTEEVNANAKLIAAAPDLLEAVRLLLRDNECQEMVDEAVNIGIQAIKKATS